MDCMLRVTKIGVLKTPNEGLAVFVVNCLAPGIGTLYTAVRGGFFWNNAVIGVVQILTAPILIGWLWSMLTGYMVWNKAKGMF